jgi:adenosylcobinamide kinase/adenosylcobinamide-phosphate guanylyltransferase
VVFVATAEAGDPEMSARIARHRAERPPAWRTVEAPLALPSTLTALHGEADVILVDCLNLWVANLIGKRPELSDRELEAEAAELVAAVARPPGALVLVSNEVGWGVHPETALGRRFRDALGLVNQAVARAADEVILMVAGCPVVVKASVRPGGSG